MERYCSTGQSLQQAVAPKEEEEEEKDLFVGKKHKVNTINTVVLFKFSVLVLVFFFVIYSFVSSILYQQ
jgi:hypothetical protein